jgi:hypothetical protein
MNEVKRVSGEFTEELKQETNGLTEEVQGIRDSIRDTANNLKDQLLKEQEEVVKKTTETPAEETVVEPTIIDNPDLYAEQTSDIHTSDIYHISASQTVPPPHKGYNNECHPSELEIPDAEEVKSSQTKISQPISNEADLNQKNSTPTNDQQ